MPHQKTPHGYRTSDLPDFPVVQEAFDIAYTHKLQELDGRVAQRLRFLDEEKEKIEAILDRQLREGEIRLPAYHSKTLKLEERFKAERAITPSHIQKVIDGEFDKNQILPVKLILENARNNSPRLAAAALLFSMSYEDIRNMDLITHVAGAEATAAAAELLFAGNGSVASYTEELSYASPSAKTLYLACSIGTLEGHIAEMQSYRSKGYAVNIEHGSTQNLFDRFRATLGNEPVLDIFFVDTFNRFCTAAEIKLSIQNDAEGKPYLAAKNAGKLPPGLAAQGPAGLN